MGSQVAPEAVILRPIEEADAATIQRWFSDPETMRWMAMGREAWTAERTVAWIREHQRTAVLYGICSPGHANLCGWIGLFDIDWLSRKAELRIVLGDNRGKGFGTAACRGLIQHAFNNLNLHRVWLGTATANLAAIQCFERAGFVREGVLVEDFYRHGHYYDNVRMAVRKTTWRDPLASLSAPHGLIRRSP